MSTSSRRLSFAVGSSLLTASLSLGVACTDGSKTSNPGPKKKPEEVKTINEGPQPEPEDRVNEGPEKEPEAKPEEVNVNPGPEQPVIPQGAGGINPGPEPDAAKPQIKVNPGPTPTK